MFLSLQAAKSRALKPGKEGKFIELRTPPAFMSLIRSCTSKHPGRISSKAVGSTPYSSLGRPATAFNPMFGMWAPLNNHTSLPSARRSTRGANSWSDAGSRPVNKSGGSTRWSSTLTMVMSSTCTSPLPPSARKSCGAGPHLHAAPRAHRSLGAGGKPLFTYNMHTGPRVPAGRHPALAPRTDRPKEPSRRSRPTFAPVPRVTPARRRGRRRSPERPRLPYGSASRQPTRASPHGPGHTV